jgi:hypothetical protein
MAKGVYKDWISKDGLSKISAWALSGLTNEQIANNMGVSVKTLYEWANKYSDFCDALKRAKSIADEEVENALYKRALGYTVTLNKQKVTKDGRAVDCIEEMHIPADTTAQIFWLKNRQPEKWRDKVEQSVTVEDHRENMKDFMEVIKSGKLTNKK